MCKTNWKIKKINKYEVVKIKKFPIPTLMMHENHLIIDSVSFAPRISYTKDETILKNVEQSKVHVGALIFPSPIMKVLL